MLTASKSIPNALSARRHRQSAKGGIVFAVAARAASKNLDPLVALLSQAVCSLRRAEDFETTVSISGNSASNKVILTGFAEPVGMDDEMNQVVV